MSDRLPLFARLVASGSELANRHGVYLGRRSTGITSLSTASRAQARRACPGFRGAILLLEHTGARPESGGFAGDLPRGGRRHRGGRLEGRPADEPCLVPQPQAHPRTTSRSAISVPFAPHRNRRGGAWLCRTCRRIPSYDSYEPHRTGRKIRVVILELANANQPLGAGADRV